MDSTNQGQGSIIGFVGNHYVRSAWIAFFTLWILWGISYFLRHAFGHDERNTTPTTAAAVEDPEAAGVSNHKKGWNKGHYTNRDRFGRSHEILFENTLLLLSVLTLNTFGVGATRAVMVLAWIFVAFTVIHALTEIAIKHHFIRLGFNLVFFGITLAIGGLSFSQGWW